MAPLVISYLRFSHPNQILGDGPRRQLEAAEAYCRANGLTLDMQFRDEGVSAFRGKHRTKGALFRLLDQIESGRIPSGSTLIIEHLDRLSREDPIDQLGLLHRIIDAGIEIVTLLGDRAEVYNRQVLAAQQGKLFEILGMMLRAN